MLSSTEAHASSVRSPPQRAAEGEGYAHGLTPWSAEVAREGLMLNSLSNLLRAEYDAIGERRMCLDEPLPCTVNDL